jgi:RNA polymerase sigma factor (sigma-70 family)
VRFPRGERSDELRQVYRDNVDAVYSFFAYSVPPAEAEDLTSSTFERVIQAWGRYDPSRAGVRTWVLAIARNMLTDHYRRQKHRNALSTDEHPKLLEAGGGSADPTDALLTTDELRSLLAQLGTREREILALRYAADLPASEIAALTGLSAANVYQIISRSLRHLRGEAEHAVGVNDSA